MKEIVRITVALTISCLIAALVMGTVFAITDKAKKHNEHMNVQTTMLGLLGYGKENPAPSDLSLHTIYRYIVEEGDAVYLGYMVPVEKEGKEAYQFLLLNLQGEFSKRYPVDIPKAEAAEAPLRQAALKKVLEPPKIFTYADSTIIATRENRRLAYLLPGEFPGFKTFITVMLALDPKFSIIGLEIMEHEEDPGLGGEIEKRYFKNQFRGKSFETVKGLDVVKEPLPEEYRKVLEAKKLAGSSLSTDEIKKIREKYVGNDIFALTGATISSKAVTTGVKNMVKKFAYRVKILDDVIDAQAVPVSF